jgi:2-methylcitrate dehydratase PrpD
MFSRRTILCTAALTGAAMVGNAQAAANTGAARDENSPPDAIEPLVDHMLSTRFEAIPASALAMTRQQLLDTVAVAVAARNESGVTELRELAREIGGRRESALWGSSLRVPSYEAARANAVMAHALEFDDTFERGFLHPSAITFPAGFAVADQVGGVSGREFLAASTLAIDVACRISLASQPGVDGFAVGWHYTTLIGYLSSALIASRLIGLSRDQTINAVGIASHQAAGNAQSHLDGALAKRLGPGFASAGGVLAARLAARGLTGPRHVLEGDRGFFRQYHRNIYSRELLLGGLGSAYPAEETSFKPWPSCRGSHTSADAALQLVAEHQLYANQIERIVIQNAPSEWPFLSQPIESKRHPTSSVEAQFSIPWVVSSAFVDGRVSLSQFTAEALERRDILAMAERIATEQDDRLTNERGGPGEARIEVVTHDGRTLDKHVAIAKGSIDAPMSAAETSSKFEDCIAYAGLTPEYGRSIRHVLERFDTLGDVSALTMLLAPS